MSRSVDDLVDAASEYEAGFVTDVESQTLPPGLDEGVVRFISARKGEPDWLTEWRLAAFAAWQDMAAPEWAHVHFPPVDFQAISYYSAPKSQLDGPQSLEDVDPELLRTYEKLGIPLHEREALAGVIKPSANVAVDAVFDSVSVATTFKESSEAGRDLLLRLGGGARHPELVQKYLGTVVPQRTTSTRRSTRPCSATAPSCTSRRACAAPWSCRPTSASTSANGPVRTHAHRRRRGSHVSYLEGCTAPMRDENQLHAAVVELVALEDAKIKYSTVQNWYPGDEEGRGGIYNFVTKRGLCAGPRSKISWTQVETGQRDHLEVPERACCAATTAWASSTRWPSPTICSRLIRARR